MWLLLVMIVNFMFLFSSSTNCIYRTDNSLYSIHTRIFSGVLEEFNRCISPLGIQNMEKDLNVFRQKFVEYVDVEYLYEEGDELCKKWSRCENKDMECLVQGTEECGIKGFKKEAELSKRQISLPVICGGAFVQYVEENRTISTQFCKELYLRLSREIEHKVQNDTSYDREKFISDMTDLESKYTSQALGPAKFEVLPEMSKGLESRCKAFLERQLERKEEGAGFVNMSEQNDLVVEICDLRAILKLMETELQKAHNDLERERLEKTKKMKQDRVKLDETEMDKAAKSRDANFSDIVLSLQSNIQTRRLRFEEMETMLQEESRSREAEIEDVNQREGLLSRIWQGFKSIGRAIASPFRRFHRWLWS